MRRGRVEHVGALGTPRRWCGARARRADVYLAGADLGGGRELARAHQLGGLRSDWVAAHRCHRNDRVALCVCAGETPPLAIQRVRRGAGGLCLRALGHRIILM